VVRVSLMHVARGAAGKRHSQFLADASVRQKRRKRVAQTVEAQGVDATATCSALAAGSALANHPLLDVCSLHQVPEIFRQRADGAIRQ